MQSQQYFDATVGGGAQGQSYSLADSGQSQMLSMSQAHSQYGGSAGSYVAQNTTSVSMMSSLAGSAPSLTFTPSGSSGSAPPAFRNVKKTMKTLADNYENAVGAAFNADAAFLQNYITDLEKEKRSADPAAAGSAADRDEKPLPEPEVKADAEVFALLQHRAALDAFRQTAYQAAWTSRNLPSTGSSHFDADFQLPSLDNPTLGDVKQNASEQIRFVARYRKSLADCITAMVKALEEPTSEELQEFLKAGFHLQSN